MSSTKSVRLGTQVRKLASPKKIGVRWFSWPLLALAKVEVLYNEYNLLLFLWTVFNFLNLKLWFQIKNIYTQLCVQQSVLIPFLINISNSKPRGKIIRKSKNQRTNILHNIEDMNTTNITVGIRAQNYIWALAEDIGWSEDE